MTMDKKSLEFALDQGRLAAEAKSRLPSSDDYQRELGSAYQVLKENPDGTIEARIRGHDAVCRGIQMRESWRRIERERGSRMSAARAVERVRHPDGRVIDYPADQARTAGRKGRVRAHVAFRGLRVVTGPDGLLWRQISGERYEPLKRCSLSRPFHACRNPECQACR